MHGGDKERSLLKTRRNRLLLNLNVALCLLRDCGNSTFIRQFKSILVLTEDPLGEALLDDAQLVEVS